MHALLHHPQTAIADMSAVIVVAEEDQAGDIFALAQHLILRPQNIFAMSIAFGAVGGAGTVAIFGNDDRLVRKSRVYVVDHPRQIRWPAGLPAAEIFIAGNKVHKAGYVLLRRREQRVGGGGAQALGGESFRRGQPVFREVVGWRLLPANFVTEPPGTDARMIAVRHYHLAQLFNT